MWSREEPLAEQFCPGCRGEGWGSRVEGEPLDLLVNLGNHSCAAWVETAVCESLGGRGSACDPSQALAEPPIPLPHLRGCKARLVSSKGSVVHTVFLSVCCPA